MTTRWLPWTIAAVLAVILVYYWWSSGPLTVAQALSRHSIDVQVSSTDDQHVAVTISQVAGASGDVTVVLPAGTVIHNGDANGQRLITAAAVTFHISDASPTQTASVEVYCLDQFKLLPTTATALSLPDQEDETETEETEPVRKLADCMQDAATTHGARQLAVWLAEDGNLNKSYSELREHLIDSYRTSMTEQAKTKLDDMAGRLHRDMPDMPQDKIEAAVERYRTGKFSAEIDEAAQTQADKDLDGYRNDARPALDKCGYDTASSNFFETAPAG